MILELTAEQLAFKKQVEQFARDVVAQRAAFIDRSGEFPSDVIRAAADAGLCGITIPKIWGGGGRDYVSYALAIEAIAKASATVAVDCVGIGRSKQDGVAGGDELTGGRVNRACRPRSAA